MSHCSHWLTDLQIVGLVMAYVSVLAGAITIAAWNIVSFIPEYYLLRNLYNSFPALSIKAPLPQSKNLTSFQRTFKKFIVLIDGWKVWLKVRQCV